MIHAAVRLTYIEGSSNKEYLARVVEEPAGSFTTEVEWGAIGAKRQSGAKYAGPSREAAFAAYERVVGEKRGKGYREVLDDAPAGDAPARAGDLPEDATGMARFGAQLAGDRGLASLADAVADPARYAVEEKFDGFRALIAFAPDGSIAVRNRDGADKGRLAAVPSLAAALEALAAADPTIRAGTVIDGELVGRTWAETAHLLAGAGRTEEGIRFVAFDLPYLAGLDLRDHPWSERREALEALLAGAAAPIECSLLLAPHADLADQVWARGGEGLIVKDRASRYLPGDRGAWSKVKELATADAVVIGLEPGNGKYAGMTGALILGQWREGALVEVTRVSGMTDIERAAISESDLGRVVEFAYHQRTATSYRHPRFARWRDDRSADSCAW